MMKYYVCILLLVISWADFNLNAQNDALVTSASGDIANQIYEQLKNVKQSNIHKNVVQEISRLTLIAVEAQKIGGYNGMLLSDAAIRMIYFRAYRALMTNALPLQEISKLIEKVPPVLPDRSKLVGILGGEFAVQGNSIPATEITYKKVLSILGLDEFQAYLDYAKLDPSISKLLKTPNIPALIIRISLTDYIQNTLFPIALAYEKSGGQIGKINLADVTLTEPLLLEAQKMGRPSLRGTPESISLTTLKCTGEDIIHSDSVMLLGYKP